jgi:hypothetical protein
MSVRLDPHAPDHSETPVARKDVALPRNAFRSVLPLPAAPLRKTLDLKKTLLAYALIPADAGVQKSLKAWIPALVGTTLSAFTT